MVAHERLIGKTAQNGDASLSDNSMGLRGCLTRERTSAIHEEIMSKGTFQNKDVVLICKVRKQKMCSAQLLFEVFERAGYRIDRYLQSDLYHGITSNVQVAKDVALLLKEEGFTLSQGGDTNLVLCYCLELQNVMPEWYVGKRFLLLNLSMLTGTYPHSMVFIRSLYILGLRLRFRNATLIKRASCYAGLPECIDAGLAIVALSQIVRHMMVQFLSELNSSRVLGAKAPGYRIVERVPWGFFAVFGDLRMVLSLLSWGRKSMVWLLNRRIRYFEQWLIAPGLGSCLILKRWEVEKSISEISFDRVQYWIQIYDLPPEMQTLANFKKFRDSIGRVVMLEKPDWSQGIGRCYMRIRLELDVNKPLIPGFWVPRQDKGKLWVRLKYEKLGDFCFSCGKIGHLSKFCDAVTLESSRESAYGPWMKAALVRTVLEERLISFDEQGTPELPWDGSVNENAGILIRKRPESSNGGTAELDEDELRALGLWAEDGSMAAREEMLIKHIDEHVGSSGLFCKARGNSVDNVNVERAYERVGKVGETSGARNVGECAGGYDAHAELGKQIVAHHVDNPLSPIGKGDKLGASSLGVLVESAVLVQNETISTESHGKETYGDNDGNDEYGLDKENLFCEEPVRKYNQVPVTTINEVTKLGNVVLHQVEIGLSSFFRNLNLKRRFEDGIVQNEFTSKRIWVESENGYSIRYIYNERNMAVDMDGLQNSDAEVVDKTNIVMVSRRMRNKARITGGGRLKEPPKIYEAFILELSRCGTSLDSKALKELIRKNGPQILFIMESKNKRRYMENLKRKLKFKYGFYVDPQGLSGGLALWWNDDVSVSILRSCKNLIDSTVTDVKNGVVSRIFWVYGPPEAEDRSKFWQLVQRRMEDQNIPWMCLGDFNDILYLHEKEGGNIKEYWKIRNFRDMVDGCNLIDLPFQGQKFTWIGKRDGLIIKERLDRALVNTSWIEQYPNTQVFNNPIIG
ncbi:Endonuclease/exonuclease/phosphatase [Corchorus capsularis]|uniref:Endonuclease/exonuclease/phosphatase n=1 Tax=Corchorus capsularis TaxID=210143 RepID=A0A1R3GT13_COCAP|nr:Endonuclease/exonuclease/phosphatase [Corchorus capsularis]